LSETFHRTIMQQYRAEPAPSVPFAEPLVANAVRDVPVPDARAAAYRAEGIESVLAVPLTVGKRAIGTVVFYHRSPHEFSEVEVHTARALGTLSAAAIATAELLEEQRRSREQAERANQQAAFLAAAGAAIAGSLDYEATLTTVVGMAVPRVADWCAV